MNDIPAVPEGVDPETYRRAVAFKRMEPPPYSMATKADVAQVEEKIDRLLAQVESLWLFVRNSAAVTLK